MQVQHFLNSAVGASAAEAEAVLLDAATKTRGKFAVGDVVQVTKGDLKGMRGEVAEVDTVADSANVLPHGLEGFTEKLTFKIGELQKFVPVGARVKVRRQLGPVTLHGPAMPADSWPRLQQRPSGAASVASRRTPVAGLGLIARQVSGAAQPAADDAWSIRSDAACEHSCTLTLSFICVCRLHACSCQKPCASVADCTCVCNVSRAPDARPLRQRGPRCLLRGGA